jgi:hypothetical protein
VKSPLDAPHARRAPDATTLRDRSGVFAGV